VIIATQFPSDVSVCRFFQYVFQTEVDASKKHGVHDELAKLLVQYLKQTSSDGNYISRMLEVGLEESGDEGGEGAGT